MKYYLKQLFCIHDFYYFVNTKQNRGIFRYNFIQNGHPYVARQVFQVMAKCLKCDKEKIYKEYFGDDGSKELSIETAKALNNFRNLKNNQSN